jgi:hypothetical protein
MENDYTISIREDDCKINKFMIVISKNKSLVGIPIRGISLIEAKKLLDPMRYSFQYGFNEMKDTIYRAGLKITVCE